MRLIEEQSRQEDAEAISAFGLGFAEK